MRLRAAFALLAVALLTVSFRGMAAARTALAPADANTAATVAIQDCVDRVGGDLVGLPELERRCPDLRAALQAAGVEPLLIDSSRVVIDRDSLRQLPALIHRAVGPAPPVAALGPILRGLRVTPAPPKSWWERLLEWLGEHLAPQQRSTSAPPWLTGVLHFLPRLQWLWTAMIWCTLMALPIVVAIVVMREVRALGRRSVDEPLIAGEAAATGLRQSQLALLHQAPMGQRPAQLFAMLIARLVAAGRLPPDRSLTHREITRRVRLEDVEQRYLLETLARLSERQLYCGAASTPPGLDEVLSRGEDLYTTGWGRPLEP
ncbi:MAG TPA: hypothetical protein VIY90_08960 [Steroidobacteraceae bacterium]